MNDFIISTQNCTVTIESVTHLIRYDPINSGLVRRSIMLTKQRKSVTRAHFGRI